MLIKTLEDHTDSYVKDAKKSSKQRITIGQKKLKKKLKTSSPMQMLSKDKSVTLLIKKKMDI